ncbi:Ig-like domain-containing protein [Curtobacterium flaccumfaciens]|uniref:Ig-like domain-containing protein n=1 Tax=Curtobacterium flaccumfaciens TaxID=2035 RepID=UPI003F7F8298
MASTSFRSAAVVCGILTASLGFGLLTPAVATAAPSASAAQAEAAAAHDLDAITVDPALTAPRFLQDWSTLHGARIVAGDAGRDAVWLLAGDEVLGHSPAGGVFFLNVQDRHKDLGLEVIRVHTAADGTQTRTERIAMPRMVQVDGLQEQNTFTPGTTHFAGSATAGATIVAKDTLSGDTLFTTKASGSRAGTGTWSADADLADAEHVITLTQTTTEGRTNELRDVRFAPTASDAPAAPTLETTERRLDGTFVLTGEYADSADSVVVQDASGATITDATLAQTGYVAKIPQERIGSTVYVVAKAADGTPSSRTAASLAQLPTDASVPKPTLRSVFVHADGRVQVVGEPDGAPGLWILDGDRVIDGIAHNDLWSYVIRAQETGKQLEIANLGFDGQGFSSLSERVALPRLLQVDGIKDENTYTPGARAFEGTAEAGATITATDQSGRELFKTPVTGARSGVGTWKASADLTSTAGYDVTFTQTTADGRTSVMRNIAFTSEDDSVAPIVVETPAMNGTATGPRPTFTGTGQAGATIEIRGTTRVVTTAKVESDGTWSAASNIDLARGSYALTAKQTAPGDATTEAPVRFAIAAAASAPITVTSPEMNGTTTGARPTFTGTGQAGATIEIRGTTRVVTTAKVESNGAWSAASNIDLARGSYALTAKQTAPGNATTEAPVRFTIN